MEVEASPQRRAKYFLIGALLCAATGTAAAQTAGSPVELAEKYLLFVGPGQSPPGDIQALATYDGAILASITPSQARGLAGQGIRMKRLEDPTWIRVPGHRFDTRQGEPDIPPSLRAKETWARAPYLVQFIGPLHPHWKQEITGAGGTFARYGNVNNNGWVVLTDRDARDGVSRMPFVHWVGSYHPAYKISGSLSATVGAPADSAGAELRHSVADRAAWSRDPLRLGDGRDEEVNR